MGDRYLGVVVVCFILFVCFCFCFFLLGHGLCKTCQLARDHKNVPGTLSCIFCFINHTKHSSFLFEELVTILVCSLLCSGIPTCITDGYLMLSWAGMKTMTIDLKEQGTFLFSVWCLISKHCQINTRLC